MPDYTGAFVSFEPDHAGLERYLKGREVREMLYERAKVGQRYVRARAPVGPGRKGKSGGQYKARIEVFDAGNDLRDGTRAEVHLIANVSYSPALEWGTARPRKQGGYTAALHLMRGAIDHIERGI